MKCNRAERGKTVTLPRGVSPGSPPETVLNTAELWGISPGGAVGRADPDDAPLWTEPVAAEHRGIFACEAATGANPTYPDHVKPRGISLGETRQGLGLGEPPENRPRGNVAVLPVSPLAHFMVLTSGLAYFSCNGIATLSFSLSLKGLSCFFSFQVFP